LGIYYIINEKVDTKVFWLFKNGQKKCPKLKRGDILSQNATFVTEMSF